VVVAHCPAFGVNVYVTGPLTLVLIADGFQVPEIPFSETACKDGAGAF
jgi:hypothetical protein